MRTVPFVCLTVCLTLTPLLITGCASSEPAADSPATVAELRRENERLRDQLDEARERNETSRRGETVEVLSTDVYFESGSADLTPEGVDKLQDVAARIKGELSGRVIRVEGHTDDTPIGDKLKDKWPSNWELSAARSAAVVRHLQWTHDVAPQRFEVVAYGPYQPVTSNDTEDGRSRNRRVRVAVLPEKETAPSAQAGEGRW